MFSLLKSSKINMILPTEHGKVGLFNDKVYFGSKSIEEILNLL
mgnify:CR=1 FL=1